MWKSCNFFFFVLLAGPQLRGTCLLVNTEFLRKIFFFCVLRRHYFGKFWVVGVREDSWPKKKKSTWREKNRWGRFTSYTCMQYMCLAWIVVNIYILLFSMNGCQRILYFLNFLFILLRLCSFFCCFYETWQILGGKNTQFELVRRGTANTNFIFNCVFSCLVLGTCTCNTSYLCYGNVFIVKSRRRGVGYMSLNVDIDYDLVYQHY